MKLVRPRTSDDVDDTAGSTSSLCSIAIRLDGDLLNTFYIGFDSDSADNAFVVIDAIHHPIVESIVLTINGETGSICSTIIRTATAAQSIPWTLVSAWDELNELNEVTTIEWEVLHRFSGNG